eukprot:TRINITY_DN4912_c0_g1_i2.p1 TRINITY_DN4912_c0_g1~~TRINITY_DN4912_c0_g1_i2.p1  ORF type:complete len:650 (-),score=153.73 TRINITY_DN4912_c0_g1_i2:7-1719(-)
MDGPAPLPKLLQQKRRRASLKENPSCPLSPLSLTPGSVLMEQIKRLCCYYAHKKLDTSHQSFEILISAADVPGEGEIKIIQQLAFNDATLKKHKLEHSHIILSDDSDLLLLSLNAQIQGVFVSSAQLLYDIDELYAALFGNFLKEQVRLNGADLSRNAAIVTDFTFLCILGCGNDYVPGITELNLGKLFTSFKRNARRIISFRRISKNKDKKEKKRKKEAKEEKKEEKEESRKRKSREVDETESSEHKKDRSKRRQGEKDVDKRVERRNKEEKSKKRKRKEEHELEKEENLEVEIDLEAFLEFLSAYHSEQQAFRESRFVVIRRKDDYDDVTLKDTKGQKRSQKPDAYLRACLWAIHLQQTKECIEWGSFYPFVCAPSLDQMIKWTTARIESGKTKMAFSDFSYIEVKGEIDDGPFVGPTTITDSVDLTRFLLPLSPLQILAATLPPHGSKILPKEMRKPFRELFAEDHYEYGAVDASPNALALQISKAIEIVPVTPHLEVSDLLFQKRSKTDLAEESFSIDLEDLPGLNPLEEDLIRRITCTPILKKFEQPRVHRNSKSSKQKKRRRTK